MSLRPVSISESSEREIPVAVATCAREKPREVRIVRSFAPSEPSYTEEAPICVCGSAGSMRPR